MWSDADGAHLPESLIIYPFWKAIQLKNRVTVGFLFEPLCPHRQDVFARSTDTYCWFFSL